MEFLAAAANFSSFTVTGADRVPYRMMKHGSSSNRQSLLLSISHPLSLPSTTGKTYRLPSNLSFSSPASQSFLNASFYLVYSSFWSLTSFSPLQDDFRPFDPILYLSLSISNGFSKQVGLSGNPCYYRLLYSI